MKTLQKQQLSEVRPHAVLPTEEIQSVVWNISEELIHWGKREAIFKQEPKAGQKEQIPFGGMSRTIRRCTRYNVR